jgi:hypothetical protein
MSVDEIDCFLKEVNNKRYNEWEQIRTQCFYTVVSQNGTKQFKQPSDLFQLPWDNKKSNKQPKKLDKKQFDQKVEQACKILNNGK